jgi:hypothetical protein
MCYGNFASIAHQQVKCLMSSLAEGFASETDLKMPLFGTMM